MSKWFDPHTVSRWLLSRLVRKPLLSVIRLLSVAYIMRHGPEAPTPRHIVWLNQLYWRLTTEEHKRQLRFNWRSQYPELPDLEDLHGARHEGRGPKS